MFEQAWAAFCGRPHAIGVGSGTDALQLILRALGIEPGDEVITVANSFIATAEESPTPAPGGARRLRTRHVFDRSAAVAARLPRTRAIIPVHLYGQPANLETLRALTLKHGSH